MAFLDDFQGELQNVIASTWTDVQYVAPDGSHLSGFWTSVQALHEQIVEDLKAATIPFPCVVLQFGEERLCQDYSIDGDAYYLPFSVHRIELYGPSANQNTLAAKCRSLKKAIDDGNFTNFQIIERGSIDTSDMNPVQLALSANSKVQVVAASVSWDKALIYPNG